MLTELKDWLMENLYDDKHPSKPGSTATFDENRPITLDVFDYLPLPDSVLKVELDKLPAEYIDQDGHWWKLTCFFKSLDKNDLWKQVSRRSSKFDNQQR
jgi:hypothetical protein